MIVKYLAAVEGALVGVPMGLKCVSFLESRLLYPPSAPVSSLPFWLISRLRPVCVNH